MLGDYRPSELILVVLWGNINLPQKRMAITTEDILKALSYVEEPDLGKDLVTLNVGE